MSTEVDADHLLIVATDRLSAFDVVLPQPIPGKGEVLTRWPISGSPAPRDIIPNHLSDRPLSEAVVRDPENVPHWANARSSSRTASNHCRSRRSSADT